jgi:hypothetical protein
MPVLLLELVAVEILPSCLATAHKEQMVRPQTGGIRYYDKRINEHGEWNAPDVDGMSESAVVTHHPHKDMCQAGSEQEKAHDGTRCHERQKVAVVAAANAIVEPNTVMILRFDAGITHAAMVCSWRAPDIARFAEFDRHFHCRRVAVHRRREGLHRDPFGSDGPRYKGILAGKRWGMRV